MIDTNKLKSLIVAAGKTQKEVAQEAGMSTNTLSNKVSGRRDFTVGEVLTLCKILGITDNAEKAKIFLG